MQPLMLHRTCNLGPIRAVTAGIKATALGADVEFRLDGRIDAIRLPEPAQSVRTDDLWKTTCLEFFWQPIGEMGYREFNFSPSGAWAAYQFGSYREGMQELAVNSISISSAQQISDGQGGLLLKASVAADLPSPAQVGLSAVIEHLDGNLQYWAIAFGLGPADFHSEACRQLIVERE